jgi:hypothetical protein
MKDNNPVLGTAIVDLSKEYLSCTESKIMVILLSNQHNLDYNGLLIKSKLRIGLSKEDEKASNKVVLNKKNNMKAIKVHSSNPLRRKNTFDYISIFSKKQVNFLENGFVPRQVQKKQSCIRSNPIFACVTCFFENLSFVF